MESKNLIIRPSNREDLETFYKWEIMPEVTKFFSIRDNQTMEEVVEVFEEAEVNSASKQFTIIAKEENSISNGQEKLIGRIVLADIIPGWKCEIFRIYIGELEYRGRGLGEEAMKLIMNYCFNKLDVVRLYLDHYTDNPASHLYLKLGFSYEGILRKNCRKNGILYDVHLMSILRDEYNEKRFYSILEELNIDDYIIREHEALFSTNQEGAENFMFPGVNLKNLLIKDKKTMKYYLLVLEDHVRMNQKHFKQLTGWRKNRFATEEELWELMKIKPGSVTPYGLFNDSERKITLVLGRDIVNADNKEWLNLHPCRNTATISIHKIDFMRIMNYFGNEIILENE